jgi:hypothetical protein
MRNEQDFRALARQALSAARIELDSSDPARLAYAALRLRMAMEALTYERAHAYRGLLPPEQCEAWQPKKMMQALLDLDPLADQGGTLFVGLEDTPGVPAKEMSPVGTENVLGLKPIKRHYDALGSFLHLPTAKQMRSGTAVDPSTIRERCTEAIAAIELALSSGVYNLVMGRDISFDCLRCSASIVRRTPLVHFEFETRCGDCGASYWMQGDGSECVTCTPPGKAAIACLKDGCLGKHDLWIDEYKEGTTWECEKCGAPHKLVLRPRLEDPKSA